MSWTKEGNKMQAARAITQEHVAGVVSSALRSRFSDRRHAAKTIARHVGRDPRAVQNWMSGHCPPRAAELVELMAKFDEVYEAVIRLAGHEPKNLTEEQQKRLDGLLQLLRA